jgi:hypothetical protein
VVGHLYDVTALVKPIAPKMNHASDSEMKRAKTAMTDLIEGLSIKQAQFCAGVTFPSHNYP